MKYIVISALRTAQDSSLVLSQKVGMIAAIGRADWMRKQLVILCNDGASK